MRLGITVFLLNIFFCPLLLAQNYLMGHVTNKRGFVIEDVKIMILPHDLTLRSSNKGSFFGTVKENIPLKKEDIIIKLPFDTSADFDIFFEDKNIEIVIDIPPRAVHNIKLLDTQGEALSDVKISASGKSYTTDSNGNINVKGKGIDNETKLDIEDAIIDEQHFNFKNSEMLLFVKFVEEDSDDSLDLSQIDELALRKSILDQRRGEVKQEIKELEYLLNQENISSAEKERIKSKLKALKSELGFINNEQQEIEADALNQIQRLENIAGEQFKKLKKKEKAFQKAQQDKLKAQESEKRSKLNYKKNLVIFSISSVFLLSLIGIFLITNRRLHQQKQEIHDKNQEIEGKNLALEDANKAISAQHKKITDSIEYAQAIQTAILPKQQYLNKSFEEDYFVLYKPKDVVSGDFYWTLRTEEAFIIVVADCTGHGVPGGFMTMLGISSLNQIVVGQGVQKPDEILNKLNTTVRQNLGQEEVSEEENTQPLDGINLQILTVYPQQKQALYSAAKSELIFMKQGKYHRLKGDNHTIGYPKSHSFKEQVIDLDGDETFYIYTDGFADQLGGDHPKAKFKYMKNRFIKLLQSINQSPLDKQNNLLQKEYNEWKKECAQTDDVTILAFKTEHLLKSQVLEHQ